MRHTLLYILLLVLVPTMMRAQGDVDTRIAVNQQVDDKTFVVVIANEQYKHEQPVPYALNDGETFRLYCEKTLGIPERNIKYVPNATLGEMNFALYWLGNVLQAFDSTGRAIVYYSGHGMPDEKGSEAYLLPTDGFSQSTEGALSTRTLYQKLGQMPTTQVVVFLDACFSGAKRNGQMMASSRGVAIKAKPSQVAANTVVFSAAQGDETAYPFNDAHHGMFTYYVLEKLQERGGHVMLGELADYVTQKVKRQAVLENNGKPQTPTVVAAQQNSDWRQWLMAASVATTYEQRQPAAAAPVVAEAPAVPQPQQPVAQASQQPSVQPQQQSVRIITPVKNDPTVGNLIIEGKKAMRAMNYERALECFTKAADKSDPEGIYQLGLLYANSNFDGYDKEQATRCFLRAANNYHVEAMYQAGMMLLGTDNDAAKLWLQKAAQSGHTRADKQLLKIK